MRAGGKHNDLENVGYTACHHTFFEMLGKLQLRRPFKHDAIQFAWQPLTSEKWFALLNSVCGLPSMKATTKLVTREEEGSRRENRIIRIGDNKGAP